MEQANYIDYNDTLEYEIIYIDVDDEPNVVVVAHTAADAAAETAAVKKEGLREEDSIKSISAKTAKRVIGAANRISRRMSIIVEETVTQILLAVEEASELIRKT